MYGRYGVDQLSTGLLWLSIILAIIAGLTGMGFINTLSYIPLFISLYRMFSKDIQKRRMENYKFSMFLSPLYGKLNRLQRRLQDSKTHKHFKCSKCKTILRVPRGKGKVVVTCPKCREKFTKTT